MKEACMMRIGEFAKTTGLSIKTLRHYHRLGLLMPDLIDDWTGYRYYSDTALQRVQRIIELRAFGFSLRDISDILTHDETNLINALRQQRHALHQQLRTYNHTMLAIEHSIRTHEEKTMAYQRFQIDHDTNTRVSAWLQRHDEVSDNSPSPPYVFTIDCAYGALGGSASLAAVLAQRVGFDPWDDVLIDAITHDPIQHQAIMATLDDDTQRSLEDTLDARLQPNAPSHAHARSRVIAALASKGSAIFVNVAANALLPKTRAMRVLLAPDAAAVPPHAAARLGIDIDNAREQVNTLRETLSRYARDTFDVGIEQVSAYDVVINSATLDVFSAVELAVQAFESRFAPAKGWWSHGR